MRRILGLIFAVTVAVLLASSAARAQQSDPGSEPGREYESPRKRLEGGDAIKWRRPIRAWPLLELDRFDRNRLGAMPGDPGLHGRIDFDLVWPLFGYHNEVRNGRANDAELVERGYFYALPLWWNTWSGARTTHTLFPVATVWNGPSKSGVSIYPALFDLDVWEDGFELDFPWPFAQLRVDEDSWSSRVWPVWWAGANERRHYWTVFPLFSFWQDGYDADRDEHLETGLITPLGGGYRNKLGHYAMITPLYHDRRQGTERWQMLLPLFLNYEDGDTRALITPLASFVSDDEDLYWAITPLYHRWRNADHTEGADVLFPLVWNFFDDDEQLTLVLPVAGAWRGDNHSGVAVGPVYALWDKEGHLFAAGLWPLLWYEETAKHRTRSLWPLYGERRFYGGSAERWSAARGGKSFTYSPDEFYRREASVGWPFLQWVSDERDGRRQAWFPWPLVTAGRTDEHAWFHAGPALYTNANEHGLQMELAPLALGPVGTYTHGSDSFFLGVLWPWGLNLSVDDHEASFWLAWPALRWWHNSDGDWTFRLMHEGLAIEREDDRFEWRLLYRFMRYRSTDDDFLFEFNPFFRYESEGADWHFSLFMGAYQVWTHGDELRHQLFWSIEW